MEKKHFVSRYTLILCAAGIGINLLLSSLVLYYELPIFLDSVGTVLAAAIGGYLPGIIVGFFSNVINGMSDPITLYYAIISILISCAVAHVYSKKKIATLPKMIYLILILTLIGGGVGSVLTWLLYGFSFGSGISAPFAVALYENFGLSQFAAQLSADFIIDLIDKIITVLLSFCLLKLCPKKLIHKLSGRSAKEDGISSAEPARPFSLRHSLRSKVVMLIAFTSVVLGVTSIGIGTALYNKATIKRYESTAEGAARVVAGVLNVNKIRGFLYEKEETEEYLAEQKKLEKLMRSVPEIEYIYVYAVKSDGCHVVFDIDTPQLIGDKLGDIIPIEEAFAPYEEQLLEGRNIPTIISNGSYGWLLTSYCPIRDEYGKCVAYAAADISMRDVVTDRAVFIIKMASLLFGISMVIVSFALWFAERQMVDPINAMANAAADFAFNDDEQREATTAIIENLPINTRDEIENLHKALKKTVTDVASYISDISNKNRIISALQENIVISFANMVENRDNNTGTHIKRTAAYVHAIAEELEREGKYPDIIDGDYVEKITKSAPLHDLGKIEVTDAILNKPGKLTPEEFEQMKAHTTAGRDILLEIISGSEGTKYLSDAVDMAYCHHERWDGCGYPRGIRGEEIPLSARIMAVADVYDALISKRAYKEAFDRNTAFEIILGESESHFDPVVVQAFVQARERIEKI